MTTDESRDPSMGLAKDRREHPRCCTARRTDGQPCRRYAARGANVCRVHGGAAPQVQAAARRRLQQATDALAARLLGIALDDGASEAVRLAAIRDALDRGGVSTKHAMDVEIAVQPWQEVAGDISGIARVSRVESRARRGLAPEPPALPALPAADPGDIYDAEIVDPPPPGPTHEPSWVQDAQAEAAAERNRPGNGLMTAEQAAIEMSDERLRQTGTRRIKSTRGRSRG